MYEAAYKMLGGNEANVHTLGQTLEVIRAGLPIEMMDKATDILGVTLASVQLRCFGMDTN